MLYCDRGFRIRGPRPYFWSYIQFMNIYITIAWEAFNQLILRFFSFVCVYLLPSCRVTQCGLARGEHLQDRRTSVSLTTVHLSHDHLFNLPLNSSVAFSHANQTESSDR